MLKITLTLSILLIISGCGFVAQPKLVTDKRNIDKVDLNGNGLVAFKFKCNNENYPVYVILESLETGKKYKIEMNYALMGSWRVIGVEVSEKKRDKNMISDSVLIYEFPPGNYRPIENGYMSDVNGERYFKTTGETVLVEPNKITSLGMVNISLEVGMFKKTKINITSIEESILDDIKNVEDDRIASLEVLEQKFSSKMK